MDVPGLGTTRWSETVTIPSRWGSRHVGMTFAVASVLRDAASGFYRDAALQRIRIVP